MKNRYPLVLLLFFMIIGCNKSDDLSKKNEQHLKTVPTLKSWDKISALMLKAKRGDADSAYDLMTYYAVDEQMPFEAHFWGVQANKLGHPHVTSVEIKSLENGVWNLVEDKADAGKVEYVPENEVLPKE